MTTLLPRNRTDFEVAMETAMKEGQGISDLVIRHLWNPDTCPIDVLPWLAWALSVDKWDENWSTEVKRNVVRSSVEVHRKKGTLFAIKQAVRAVYSDSDIIEWFEYGGQPYHFMISVDIGNGQGFSYDLANDVRAVALSAKNVRSKLEALKVIMSQVGETPKLAVTTQASYLVEVRPIIPELVEVTNHRVPRVTSYTFTTQIILVYPKA